jgi:hypothetical protein
MFVFIVTIISVCYFHMPLLNPRAWSEHKRKLDAQSKAAIAAHAPAADRSALKRPCMPIELDPADDPPAMHEI